MAETKIPGGTVALPDNPELANLQERRKAVAAELARLENLDANKHSGPGHDINEVKLREKRALAELDKAIAEATK